MNEEYKHKTSKTLKLLFKYYKYEHNRNNKYMFYMDDNHIGFNYSFANSRIKSRSKIFKYMLI